VLKGPRGNRQKRRTELPPRQATRGEGAGKTRNPRGFSVSHKNENWNLLTRREDRPPSPWPTIRVKLVGDPQESTRAGNGLQPGSAMKDWGPASIKNVFEMRQWQNGTRAE